MSAATLLHKEWWCCSTSATTLFPFHSIEQVSWPIATNRFVAHARSLSQGALLLSSTLLFLFYFIFMNFITVDGGPATLQFLWLVTCCFCLMLPLHWRHVKWNGYPLVTVCQPTEITTSSLEVTAIYRIYSCNGSTQNFLKKVPQKIYFKITRVLATPLIFEKVSSVIRCVVRIPNLSFLSGAKQDSCAEFSPPSGSKSTASEI